EHLLDLSHYLWGELTVAVRAGRSVQRRLERRVMQVLANELLLQHLPQHIATSFSVELRVLPRREVLRRRHETRERRGFGQRQLLGPLPKVEARRLLHAIASMAEID